MGMMLLQVDTRARISIYGRCSYYRIRVFGPRIEYAYLEAWQRIFSTLILSLMQQNPGAEYLEL